jgi:hypothetical protein
MPSFRDVNYYDDVLCTISNRSAPDRASGMVRQGQAAWTAHHVQNHTLRGHSTPASQAGRRVGPSSSLRPHCFQPPSPHTSHKDRLIILETV